MQLFFLLSIARTLGSLWTISFSHFYRLKIQNFLFKFAHSGSESQPEPSLENSTLSHPAFGVLQCRCNMAAVIENHKRPVRDDRVITVDLNCGGAGSLPQP